MISPARTMGWALGTYPSGIAFKGLTVTFLFLVNCGVSECICLGPVQGNRLAGMKASCVGGCLLQMLQQLYLCLSLSR